jgi:hypothetical protein
MCEGQEGNADIVDITIKVIVTTGNGRHKVAVS